jgi:hypothetical protein
MTTPAGAGDIVFTRHDARRGVAWLRDAYAMVARARVPWLMLLAIYYVVQIAVSQLPFLGAWLPLLFKPIFAVGFLAAAWTQERGGPLRVGLLFQGFRSNLRSLLPLGALFVAGLVVAVFATTLVDGGTLLDVLRGATPLTEELVQSGRLQGAMLFGALCSLPVVLALWFAPGLVVFQDAGPVAALGASLRAALANWRPLLAYGLAVFALGALLPAVIAQLLLLVLPSETTLFVVRFLLFAWLFLFAATLHASDYVSYRDVFHAGETLAPLPSGRPRQP